MSSGQTDSSFVHGHSMNSFDSELRRLSTFALYPGTAVKSAVLLARNGFIYKGTGRDDSVQCAFCKLVYKDWRVSDNISELHQRLSSSCSFMEYARSSEEASTSPRGLVQTSASSFRNSLTLQTSSVSGNAAAPNSIENDSLLIESDHSSESSHSSPPFTSQFDIDFGDPDFSRVSAPVSAISPSTSLSNEASFHADSIDAIFPEGIPHETSTSASRQNNAQVAASTAFEPEYTQTTQGPGSIPVAPSTPRPSESTQLATCTAQQTESNLVATSTAHRVATSTAHPFATLTAQQTESHLVGTSTGCQVTTLSAHPATSTAHRPESTVVATSTAHRVAAPTAHPLATLTAHQSQSNRVATLSARPATSAAAHHSESTTPAISTAHQSQSNLLLTSSAQQQEGIPTSQNNPASETADSRPAQTVPSTNIRPTFQDLGISTHQPKKPDYSRKYVRRQTFEGWPSDHHMDVEEMVEAGFYYAGYSDCARCFFCGGGLRNWEQQDNAFVEHARWFPKCAFITQALKSEFLEAVGRLHANSFENISLQSVLRESSLTGTDFLQNSSLSVLEKDSAVITLIEAGYERQDVLRAARTLKQENVSDGSLCAESLLRQLFHEGKQPQSHLDRDSDLQGAKRPIEEGDLQKEKRTNLEFRKQMACKVCLENPLAVLFLPCGHLACCSECAPCLKDCPICRNSIKGTVRVTFA